MRTSCGAVLLLMILGCAGRQSAVNTDVERAVTVWNGSGYPGQQHVCAEHLLSEPKHFGRAGAEEPDGIDGTAKARAVAVNAGPITEFGRVALYRLCEAAGNGLITEETYERLYSSTMTRIFELFDARVRTDQSAEHRRLIELRERIDAIDRRSCDLRLGRDDGPLDDDAEWARAQAERMTLYEEFEALQSSTKYYLVEPPRQNAIPNRRQLEKFENEAAAYLRLDARAASASVACQNLRVTFGPFWRGACYASDDRFPFGEVTGRQVVAKGCAL